MQKKKVGRCFWNITRLMRQKVTMMLQFFKLPPKYLQIFGLLVKSHPSGWLNPRCFRRWLLWRWHEKADTKSIEKKAHIKSGKDVMLKNISRKNPSNHWISFDINPIDMQPKINFSKPYVLPYFKPIFFLA